MPADSTSLLRRARTPLLIAVLLTVAAFGAAGYVFRDRLRAVSLISGRFAASQNHAAGHTPSASEPPIVASEGAPHGAESRAPVELDTRRQQLIGVRTAVVERTTLAQTVRTVGAVRYDETRLADVNLKIEGWIRELYVDFTGQSVAKGQPLFTLYSPDLLTTQNEYLLALKTRDQLRQSLVADARESAERLVDSARRRLELWDLPPEELRALDETRQPRTTVVFRSPVSGYVIEKAAVQGMHVMPGQTLYKVADLSVVWVEADVYEAELPLVRVGGRATVTLNTYPGERFTGRVIYIYPYVDEKTRTNKVRYEFVNRGGRLKPGMFANVEIVASGGSAVVVPTNAVLDSGKEQLVFVAKGDGYFEPRRVTIGRRLADRIQILEGLKDGEQVATGATFFLDSESQLRASLQAYEAPASSGGSPAAAGLDIVFRTLPDPPKTGENQLEATVKDPSGRPIEHAEVTVQFLMPAMPTMNMPAMRSEAKLVSAGGGVYRGSGQVMTAGRWETTVTVTRGGQRLGTKHFVVTAK